MFSFIIRALSAQISLKSSVVSLNLSDYSILSFIIIIIITMIALFMFKIFKIASLNSIQAHNNGTEMHPVKMMKMAETVILSEHSALLSPPV